MNGRLSCRWAANLLAGWALGFSCLALAAEAAPRHPCGKLAWLDELLPLQADLERERGPQTTQALYETGIRSDCQHVQSNAPAGKTPFQRMPGSRFATNMISTVTNQGKVRFMLYRGTMTAPLLLWLLAHWVRDAGRTVFLILDNPRVHHGNKVRDWLTKCWISCDHIPRRSWALFRARDVMRSLIGSFKGEQAT